MAERRCRNGGKAWPFHAGPPTAQDYATEPIVVAVRPEYAAELTALGSLLDEGLIVMTHVPDWCGCSGTATLTGVCVTATMDGMASQRNG